MRTLLISAAEPSGDLLAAELLEALHALGPVRARGIAGPRMRNAGVEPLAQMEDVCAMGLAEVLKKLGPIKEARSAMLEGIEAGADAMVVIDAPDLHLPLARQARKQGIPTIGYVSPQIWAWRPGRARHIAADLDALLCLFEFEPALYHPSLTGQALDVRWTGHPIVDRMPDRGPVDPHLYGILPGSRDHELTRHLEPFLTAAEIFREETPEARFLLVGDDSRLRSHLTLPDWVEVVPEIQALRSVRGALSKSGTVTLELALMGVPMVVAHRVHPLTYWLGRVLVRGISHIALPNILAGEEVVPEHVQWFSPKRLAQELGRLPQSQDLRLNALGASGASQRAAAAVQEFWE